MTLYPPVPRSSPAPAHCPYLVKPLFSLFSLHPLPGPEADRAHHVAGKQRLGISGPGSLVAAVMATGLLVGLGVQPLEAQAQTRHCFTLKGMGTSLTNLTEVIDSRSRLGWRCLRIIENDALQTLDLSNWTKLTYLQIKGNSNLTEIKFPPNLKYLDIENNDNDNLESLDLSKLSRLRRLQIRDNRCLKNITFPSQFTLEHLHIKNNDYLEMIDFSKLDILTNLSIEGNGRLRKVELANLTELTCLHIKDNKNLQSISAANLTDAHYIRISNNDNLEDIDLSKLDNVVHMKIEDNKTLTTIMLPGNFPGVDPPGDSETPSP